MKSHLLLIGDVLSSKYIDKTIFENFNKIHIIWVENEGSVTNIILPTYIRNKINDIFKKYNDKIIIHKSIENIKTHIHKSDKITCFVSLKTNNYNLRKFYKYLKGVCNCISLFNTYNYCLSYS